MSVDTLINNIEFIAIVIAILWAVIGSAIAAHRRKHRSVQLSHTPILLAYYTSEANLIPVQKGTIGDMHYSAIMALGDNGKLVSDKNSLLYIVELPFQTKLHLLGIPKQAGVAQLNPAQKGSLMQRVQLEGDYNKYFTLFCEAGMQTEARYMLDPKAMLFTIDFCRSHNWEITGNELYFVQTFTTKSANDPTYMHDDVVKFVQEIRPAVEVPIEHRRLIPGIGRKARHAEYQCPVCQATLNSSDGASYQCPQHHGVLVLGYKLPEVKQGLLPNPSHGATTAPAAHRTIKCPACGHAMDQVPYGGSSTVIDSCTNCPYRWLDSGELANKANA